jgi:hypothetical protein
MLFLRPFDLMEGIAVQQILNPKALPDEKETPTAILMKEVADSANGKMATLYDSGVNHYHVSWPTTRYR